MSITPTVTVLPVAPQDRVICLSGVNRGLFGTVREIRENKALINIDGRTYIVAVPLSGIAHVEHDGEMCAKCGRYIPLGTAVILTDDHRHFHPECNKEGL